MDGAEVPRQRFELYSIRARFHSEKDYCDVVYNTERTACARPFQQSGHNHISHKDDFAGFVTAIRHLVTIQHCAFAQSHKMLS